MNQTVQSKAEVAQCLYRQIIPIIFLNKVEIQSFQLMGQIVYQQTKPAIMNFLHRINISHQVTIILQQEASHLLKPRKLMYSSPNFMKLQKFSANNKNPTI